MTHKGPHVVSERRKNLIFDEEELYMLVLKI